MKNILEGRAQQGRMREEGAAARRVFKLAAEALDDYLSWLALISSIGEVWVGTIPPGMVGVCFATGWHSH
jgi:hypothetical protein